MPPGLVLLVASLSSLPTMVRADPYGNPSAGAVPAVGTHGVPPPPEAYPGKEYTDSPDRDGHTGAASPGQIVLWDGLGGQMNGPAVVPDPVHGIPDGHDIDAQANLADALFREVIADRAWLVLSTEDDLKADFSKVSLLWEAPNFGVTNTTLPTLVGDWARPNDVNHNAPPDDLNSVEIWGPEKLSDTTHVSYQEDPGGYPIWDTLHAGAGGFTYADPWQPLGYASPMTDWDIANAIGDPAWASGIDLDGLMLNEADHQMMFSIHHLSLGGTTVFDGGEIWVWDYMDRTLGAADFLSHGGHLWDTAFDVAGTFGMMCDEVDALEAVGMPESGTWLAGGSLSLIALGALWRRFARR